MWFQQFWVFMMGVFDVNVLFFGFDYRMSGKLWNVFFPMEKVYFDATNIFEIGLIVLRLSIDNLLKNEDDIVILEK